MNNKKSPFFPVLIIFLLAVFSLSQVAQGATPNFVTGLGVGNGYKINFANNADGVTWTAGVGGSINATQYTGNASTSNYALTASSVTNATTAGSLATNGTNCTAGNYPLGIDTFGNAEACTAVGGGITIAAIGATANANGMTLTGQQLNLQPASASFGGVITTGAQVLAGVKTFSSQIISTLAAGTAPFAVTSNTLVTNLNADLLDGNHASALSVNYATSAGSATSASSANALAANGANCTAGNYPLGIDASGAVEFCTALPAAVNFWGGTKNGTIYNGDAGAGNVGIGTTTPAYKLTVVGTSYLNGQITTALSGAGNRCLYVDATGNVSAKGVDCGTATGGDNMGDHTATQNILLGNYWLSGDGGNEGLFVSSLGNVGVGLSTPGAKLDISGGSIRTTNQFISTLAAGTAPFVLTSNTLVTNLNADLLDGNHASALSVNYATSAGSATSASTANALAANGANCTAGNYPLGIDASGAVEFCTALPADADTQDLGVSGNTITLVNGGSVTAPYATLAGALNANGTNCTAGQYPLGIDAAGNVESCTAVGGGITIAAIGATANANGMTLTGQQLNLQPASASFGGVITTGAQVLAGAKTFSSQIISTLAQGTAPFSVISTTTVTNLSADLLDGLSAASLSVNYATSAGSATSATTANALAANGGNCSLGFYPLGVNASGAVESCTAVPVDTDAQTLGVSGNTITLVNGGSVTAPYATLAGALNANGTNCAAGQYPLGIDAAGNAEGCTATGGLSGSGTINYVSKWSSATGLTNSIIFDNATNVGIGTTTPADKLHVVGSIRTTNQFVSTLAAGTAPFVVTSNTIVTNLNADLLDGQNASAMSVNYATTAGTATSATNANALAADGSNCTAGNYPLGVDASGNVQFCTALPADSDTQDLGVSGNTITLVNGGAITAPYATLAGSLDANGTNCGAGNYPLGVDADGNAEGCTATLTGSGAINYVSKWSSATGLTNSIIFDNATNVGIGTTNPTAKLDVSGGSIRTTNQLISTVAQGTAPLAVTSTTTVTNLSADLLEGNHASALSVNYATSAGSATSASTATALAANGSNCSPGYYALGVNASGAAEGCTILPAGGSGTVVGTGTTNYVAKWASSTGLTISSIYDTGAYVGIGTTTPVVKLDVNGGFRAVDTSSGLSFIFGELGGVNRMRLYSTGPTIRFLDSGNSYARLGFGGLSVGGTYAVSSAPTSGAIFEGNVGVGLTNPTAKLDVSGGSIRTTNQLISTVAQGTAPLAVTSTTTVTNLSADLLDGQNASAMSVNYATTAGSATSATTATSLAGNGTNCGAGNYPLGVDASGNAEGCTAAGGGTNFWGGTMNSTIWNGTAGAGNVGIGTTTVGSKFVVAGDSTVYGSITARGNGSNLTITGNVSPFIGTYDNNTLQIGSNGATAMYVTPAGRVGIGTSNVGTYKFSVSGASYFDDTVTISKTMADSILTLASVTAGSSIINLAANTGGYAIINGTGSSGNILKLQTGGVDRLTIDGSGNVGIGTSAPGRRLEVANAIVGAANDILRINNTSGGATDQVRLTLTRAADTGTGVGRGMVLFGSSGISGWADYESRALSFWTGAGAAATEKLRLSAAGGLSLGNGYVTSDPGAGNLIVQTGIGIGVTAPGTYDLNVAGTTLHSDDVTLNKTGGAVLYIAPSGSGSATLSLLSNTGGYSIINADGTADILKLQTAATDRLSIIANGNVGIGTTAPSAKLMIVANSAGDGFVSAAGAATYSPQFSLNNTTSQLGAMGLALATDHFSGEALANDIVIRATNASSNGNLIITNQNATGDIKFATGTTNTNDTLKMLIGNNGNVGIGTSSPSQKLAVAGNVAAIAFIYTSDRNLKENIKPLDNSLEKIMKLRGVSFNWKENDQPSLGLIAQEVEKVYPELVTGSVGGKGVQYGNLVAPLIEAVKTQQKEIDTLEARIKVLELKNKRK